MDNVTMAHIHQDKRGENDPVVVVLYKATAVTGPKHGILPQGSIPGYRIRKPTKR